MTISIIKPKQTTRASFIIGPEMLAGTDWHHGLSALSTGYSFPAHCVVYSDWRYLSVTHFGIWPGRAPD